MVITEDAIQVSIRKRDYYYPTLELLSVCNNDLLNLEHKHNKLMDLQTVLDHSIDKGRSNGKAVTNLDLGILAALVIVAFLLACPTMRMGIWLDEFLSIHSSIAPDPITVFKNAFGRLDDYHPPLSYMLLNCFMKVFGSGDIATKVPSLLYGLLTIPAVFWLGKTVHSARTGLLAGFFCAISPFANYFFCQCRGYSLAALLLTLTVTFYIKLNDAQYAHKRTAFVLVSLLSASLCYTELVGCVLIPALCLASLIILARKCLMTNSKVARFDALKNFSLGIASLFGGFLLFIPWIPSVLEQMPTASYWGKPTLSQWPEVFYFTTMNMLPMAIPFGICFSTGLILFFAARAFIRRIKTQTEESRPSGIFSLPDSYITLLCVVLFPCATMGYIATYWAGYYRYIYPYSPTAWVLLAIVCASIFWHREKGLTRRSRIALVISIGALLSLEIAYLVWFDSKPNSGFFTVAKEIKAGKFDNTALVITPDVIGPTLGFYVSKEEFARHNTGAFGFPRWLETLVPANIPEMAAQWRPENLVEEYERKIAELPSKGYKILAFARDNDKQIERLTSRSMPRKPRIEALHKVLNSKYELLETKYYPAVTENVTISFYKLPTP